MKSRAASTALSSANFLIAIMAYLLCEIPEGYQYLETAHPSWVLVFDPHPTQTAILKGSWFYTVSALYHLTCLVSSGFFHHVFFISGFFHLVFSSCRFIWFFSSSNAFDVP
jgi:hypothetical protein